MLLIASHFILPIHISLETTLLPLLLHYKSVLNLKNVLYINLFKTFCSHNTSYKFCNPS